MLCYGTFLKCCANLMLFGDVCNFVCIFCGICWFWGAGGVFGLVLFWGAISVCKAVAASVGSSGVGLWFGMVLMRVGFI